MRTERHASRMRRSRSQQALSAQALVVFSKATQCRLWPAIVPVRAQNTDCQLPARSTVCACSYQRKTYATAPSSRFGPSPSCRCRIAGMDCVSSTCYTRMQSRLRRNWTQRRLYVLQLTTTCYQTFASPCHGGHTNCPC
jgi:hypothetical protein